MQANTPKSNAPAVSAVWLVDYDRASGSNTPQQHQPGVIRCVTSTNSNMLWGQNRPKTPQQLHAMPLQSPGVIDETSRPGGQQREAQATAVSNGRQRCSTKPLSSCLGCCGCCGGRHPLLLLLLLLLDACLLSDNAALGCQAAVCGVQRQPGSAQHHQCWPQRPSLLVPGCDVSGLYTQHSRQAHHTTPPTRHTPARTMPAMPADCIIHHNTAEKPNDCTQYARAA
jgi:hypothetical protein